MKICSTFTPTPLQPPFMHCVDIIHSFSVNSKLIIIYFTGYSLFLARPPKVEARLRDPNSVRPSGVCCPSQTLPARLFWQITSWLFIVLWLNLGHRSTLGAFTCDAVSGHRLSSKFICSHMLKFTSTSFLSQIKYSQTWVKDAVWEHSYDLVTGGWDTIRQLPCLKKEDNALQGTCTCL